MLFVGAAYGRGARKVPSDKGCELGPAAIREMYPDHEWEMITPDWPFDMKAAMADRIGENMRIQRKVYDFFAQRPKPTAPYFFVGGDHSLNFAHFKAVAEKFEGEDIALIYIDAHTDIHIPETSPSNSPHGMTVRHLLGEGDKRWLSIGKSRAPLKPENMFYIGVRDCACEAEELAYVKEKKIFAKHLPDPDEVIKLIGNKKYIVSFDFDVFDRTIFDAHQLPEPEGLDLNKIKEILLKLITPNMIAAEFVEYAPTLGTIKGHDTIVREVIDSFLLSA